MIPSYTAFPFAVSPTGSTARESPSAHIAHLIEQVLFVDLGERVNRPHFGCALRQLVFNAKDAEIRIAIEALVQGSLRRWLGHRIHVQGLEAAIKGDTVSIVVSYTDLLTRSFERVELTRTG